MATTAVAEPKLASTGRATSPQRTRNVSTLLIFMMASLERSRLSVLSTLGRRCRIDYGKRHATGAQRSPRVACERPRHGGAARNASRNPLLVTRTVPRHQDQRLLARGELRATRPR